MVGNFSVSAMSLQRAELVGGDHGDVVRPPEDLDGLEERPVEERHVALRPWRPFAPRASFRRASITAATSIPIGHRVEQVSHETHIQRMSLSSSSSPASRCSRRIISEGGHLAS